MPPPCWELVFSEGTMRPLLLSLLFCFLASASAATSLAQARCQTTNCMCKVVSHITPEKRYNSDILVILFAEDSSTLSINDQKRILRYRATHTAAVIVGTTDGCGTRAHNHQLAAKRVAATLKLLSPIHTTTHIVGEAVAYHLPGIRRVIIYQPGNKFHTFWAMHPANTYLLDASGSMAKVPGYWEAVQTFEFPPEATIYVAKTAYCHDGMAVQALRPGGNTEIWLPYYRILERARHGDTISFLTDEQSEKPLSPRAYERLEDMVRAKQLHIHTH